MCLAGSISSAGTKLRTEMRFEVSELRRTALRKEWSDILEIIVSSFIPEGVGFRVGVYVFFSTESYWRLKEQTLAKHGK
jgi:hypothetical protein